MAKKVQKNLIITLVAILLSVLSAVTFFMPTYKTSDDSDGKARISACKICFTSQEKAQDNAKEALKEGDKDSYFNNLFIVMIKTEDTKVFTNEYRAPAVAGAWLHFVAFVASLASVVILTLTILMNKYGTISKFTITLSVLLMIASLICSIVLVNKGDFDGNIDLTICGNILGLIATIGTAVISFLPVKKVKKAKK